MPTSRTVPQALGWPGREKGLESAGIPVSGGMDDLLGKVDIVLDATSAGVGAKNKELYTKRKLKAVFQGGEKNEIVDKRSNIRAAALTS